MPLTKLTLALDGLKAASTGPAGDSSNAASSAAAAGRLTMVLMIAPRLLGSAVHCVFIAASYLNRTSFSVRASPLQTSRTTYNPADAASRWSFLPSQRTE